MTIQDLICKTCGKLCESRLALALHIVKSDDEEHEPHKKDAEIYIKELQRKTKRRERTRNTKKNKKGHIR